MGVTPKNLWVIVLAGGDGQRLSALTAAAGGVATPKQYCSLDGGPSLLQLSLQRAQRLVPRQRIVTVVTEAHQRWWAPELLRHPQSTVVVQPSNRGTGLGVLLPLLVIAKTDPTACILCMPSDHFVENDEVLVNAMLRATAMRAVSIDRLNLLGISPNAPDPGFGYLTPADDSGIGLRPVHQFIEKPDAAEAVRLIRAGGVWNSGIFAGLLPLVTSLYPRHVPGLLSKLRVVANGWSDPLVPSAELRALYIGHPTVDFSREVLQRQPARLQFLTVSPCGWHDVGTPARLAAALRARRSAAARLAAADLSTSAFSLASAFALLPKRTSAADASVAPRVE